MVNLFVILSAGKGRRMNNNDVAKTMHLLNGIPIIDYIIDLILNNNFEEKKILIIVGHLKEQIIKHVSNKYCDKMHLITFIEQKELLGTGHSMIICKDYIKNNYDDETKIIILMGDSPLIDYYSIKNIINKHCEENNDMTLLTVNIHSESTSGRIIRDEHNNFEDCVEFKDINDYYLKNINKYDNKEEIINIKEVNSGIYVLNLIPYLECIDELDNDNAQNEYYLPKLPILIKNKYKVQACVTNTLPEYFSANTKNELEKLKLAK